MSNEWQRLSPLSIMYFAVRGFMQLLNTYAVIVAGVIAFSQLGLSFGEVAAYILVAVVLLILGASLYYLNFEFIQEPTRFLIREGVFSKKRIELPFSKIQNITLKEPFYYRPFNLVVLNMDSAGSSDKEVALAALPREKAEAIQQFVQRFHEDRDVAHVAAEPDATAVNPPERTLLLTRSTFDVVLHGLAHNRAWFILAIAAPVLSQMDQPLQDLVESVGVDFTYWAEQTSVVVLGALGLLVVVGVVFLLSSFSVAGAILALYDLKLFYSKGIYQRTSGLFNRYEIQVKKTRVQTLRYQQNWLDLAANRLNMVLEPFSVAVANDNQNMMQKILLPSITHSQFCTLAQHIYPDFDFASVEICAVSPLYIVRSMLLLVLPVTLLAAVLVVGLNTWQWLAPLSAGLFLSGLLYLRWRRLGIGVSQGYVVVRGGLIGREYFCFAEHKVQQVKLKQSLPLKRRGLATLEIVLASRTLQIPLIAEALAVDIADRCMTASTLSEQSWM